MDQPAELILNSYMDGRFTVVRVSGVIDYNTAHSLKVRLFDLISSRRRRFVLDLTDARFDDFSGCAALAMAALKIREFDGSLRLVVNSQSARGFLERTGFLRFYPPEPSISAAISKPIGRKPKSG